MRYLYSAVFFVFLPVILLRLWWRGRANAGYRLRWRERFAILPVMRSGGIWLHAVSVGETLAAVPLVEALLKQYPDLPITVTCMTPTGSERVRAAFSDRVQHVYCPYDLGFIVRRFLNVVQPKLCLVMETELWPNMVHQCAIQGVPLMVVNARLSRRSARGYYRARCLSMSMLRQIHQIAAQERSDATRFAALGVPVKNIHITGTIKSDVRITETQRQQARHWRRQSGAARYTVIAASTHEGEDTMVLASFMMLKKMDSDAQLILVPRHPERFSLVRSMAKQTGLTVASRSNNDLSATTDILVGDTMGELLTLYGMADAAFVGGSLVARGGHNPLEPLAWGLPVAQGPHTFNFATLNTRIQKKGLSHTVHDAASLAEFWWQMHPEKQRMMIRKDADDFMASAGGSLARVLDLIEPLLRRERVL